MAKTNWQMNEVVQPADLNQIGQEINGLVGDVGNMSTVPTTAKTAAGAIAELFTNVSDGKTVVAAAITDKGVPTVASDTFAVMADHIGAIPVGPDTSDATATVVDILTSKTAYGATGTRLTGTMPNRGGMSLTPRMEDVEIPVGYHDGTGKVIGDPDLIPSNVKAGVNIFGVNGKAEVIDTTEITGSAAMPAHILTGRAGFVNGARVAGNMANQGAMNTTATLQNQQVAIPAGYHNGSGKVTVSISNLTATNIANGVNVGGIVGTGPAYSVGGKIPINKVGGFSATTKQVLNLSSDLIYYQRTAAIPGFLLCSSAVTNTNILNKINITTGTVIGTCTLPGTITYVTTDPVCENAYILCGVIAKVRISDMTLMWSVSHGGSSFPDSVILGVDGNIYPVWQGGGSNSSYRIERYNNSNGAATYITSRSYDDGLPIASNADQAGNVYVTEGNGRITKYNSSGTQIAQTYIAGSRIYSIVYVDTNSLYIYQRRNGSGTQYYFMSIYSSSSLSLIHELQQPNTGFEMHDQLKDSLTISRYGSGAGSVLVNVFSSTSFNFYPFYLNTSISSFINYNSSIQRGSNGMIVIIPYIAGSGATVPVYFVQPEIQLY